MVDYDNEKPDVVVVLLLNDEDEMIVVVIMGSVTQEINRFILFLGRRKYRNKLYVDFLLLLLLMDCCYCCGCGSCD